MMEEPDLEDVEVCKPASLTLAACLGQHKPVLVLAILRQHCPASTRRRLVSKSSTSQDSMEMEAMVPVKGDGVALQR